MPVPLVASTPSVPSSHHARWPRIEAFGLSHPGRWRPTNEDAFAVAPGFGFFAVADGVGGNAAGEVASRMAVGEVLNTVEVAAATCPDQLGVSLFVRAVREANDRVREAARRDLGLMGMATTFTGLLVLTDRVVVAHAGDSRAYRLRGRRLQQLTEDHTLVNACMRAGLMTAEEAEVSDIRNVIVRAIGTDDELDVDARLLGVAPGDTFLLASDGLHGVVPDDEIAAVLVGERRLNRAAEKLVARANDAGGPDNVTVVLARVG